VILGRLVPRGLIRFVAVAALAALVVVSLPGQPTDARQNRPGGKLVPSSGAFFGVTTDGQEQGPGSGLRSLERSIGRKFDLVDTYYSWWNSFPGKIERNMVRNGRIPMISWKGTYLQSIINGDYDHMIHARARALHKFGHWVFLRWGWEMNGDWNEWSGANNQPNGPSKFVRAWRRIRNIFWQENAWNVVFVWSPNDGDLPEAKWNHFTNYYPGDKYVDWVGVDGFNWGGAKSWSDWISIDAIIHPVYSTYHWRKPIMIAETGSVEQGGSKAKWISHARRALARKYPAIAAFIYYNGSDDEGAYWKVDSSRSAFQAFRNMGHDPYWNP
jgi:hypothetical protein